MPSAVSCRAICAQPSPAAYSSNIRRTAGAHAFGVSLPCTLSYPKMRLLPMLYCPLRKRLTMLHRMFSEIDRLSSCATAASTEKMNPAEASNVLMFSFSKRTSTPAAFSSRTIRSQSAMFREKREMLLTRMRSMRRWRTRAQAASPLPIASASSCLKPSRPSMRVPLP